MSACCDSDTNPSCCDVPADSGQATPNCPACGAVGKPVAVQTVRALLSVSLREVRGQHYRFCAAPACAVVYYDSTAGAVFSQDQLRERVYQKEPERSDGLICYCFRHTVGAVRDSDDRHRDPILADIMAGIQADQCECDLRNPQGTCCLGNVRGLIRQLAQGR